MMAMSAAVPPKLIHPSLNQNPSLVLNNVNTVTYNVMEYDAERV
jgi:hypothetical protein